MKENLCILTSDNLRNGGKRNTKMQSGWGRDGTSGLVQHEARGGASVAHACQSLAVA